MEPSRFPGTSIIFSNRVNTIFLMRSDVTVINQAIIVALEEAACLPTDEQAMWLALFADNDDDPFYGAGSRLLEDGTVRHVITKQAWCGFDGWQ